MTRASSSSSQQSHLREYKHKKISHACEPCKRRRSRCTGPPAPCDRCRLEQTDCAFDPGKDKRTRESRNHGRVHHALMEAFITAVQNGDTAVSRTLFDIIQKSDPTGALAGSAQASAERVSRRSPESTAGSSTPSEDRSVSWTWLAARDMDAQKAGRTLPGFACDPNNTQPLDFMSKSIVSFRNAARAEIRAGRLSLEEVIGSPLPDLHKYFHPTQQYRPFSPWTWACQLAQAFDDFAFSLKMCTIYVAGIQMRYLISPSEQTFHDLPEMLRPIVKQYQKPHAAGVDLCHIPMLKSIMLDDWDEYNSLIEAGQSCNWPYSDEAIFAHKENPTTMVTMSRAFIEHLGDINNYSIGPKILLTRPELKGYVQERE